MPRQHARAVGTMIGATALLTLVSPGVAAADTVDSHDDPVAETEPEEPKVVQTDGAVAEDTSMLAALGVAMLFAGGATAVAVGAGLSGPRE